MQRTADLAGLAFGVERRASASAFGLSSITESSVGPASSIGGDAIEVGLRQVARGELAFRHQGSRLRRAQLDHVDAGSRCRRRLRREPHAANSSAVTRMKTDPFRWLMAPFRRPQGAINLLAATDEMAH